MLMNNVAISAIVYVEKRNLRTIFVTQIRLKNGTNERLRSPVK